MDYVNNFVCKNNTHIGGTNRENNKKAAENKRKTHVENSVDNVDNKS